MTRRSINRFQILLLKLRTMYFIMLNNYKCQHLKIHLVVSQYSTIAQLKNKFHSTPPICNFLIKLRFAKNKQLSTYF